MRTYSRPCLLAFLLNLALFFLLLTAPVHAQNPRGSLRGTVPDATDARISSAKIVVQLSSSSVQREASSEDRGEFRLDDLFPGKYRVTIHAVGFAPAQADVSITVATVRDITVTMKPSSVPAEDLWVVFARHHGLRSRDEGGEEPVERLDVHGPAALAAFEEVPEVIKLGVGRRLILG